jgi:hypothetical protein
LSFDHDRLFEFHRWRANLRILEIEPVRSVPYVPPSHPYVERLIGTIRREYLDRLFLWNGRDLSRKLELFRNYYNECRVHRSLAGATPAEKGGGARQPSTTLPTTGGRAIARAYSSSPSLLEQQIRHPQVHRSGVYIPIALPNDTLDL